MILDFVGPAEVRRARKENRKPGVAFLDRRAGQCGFPILGRGRDMRVCGRVTPGPVKYCPEHDAVAFDRKQTKPHRFAHLLTHKRKR